jgi:ankyrin repeat protein
MVACASNSDVDLIYAASSGDILKAKLLLKDGANVNVTALDDLTPLIAATKKGRGEMVEVLLNAGANPNLPGGDLLPLFHAFYGNHADIAKLLLDRGGKLFVPNPVLQVFHSEMNLKKQDEQLMKQLARTGYEL